MKPVFEQDASAFADVQPVVFFEPEADIVPPPAPVNGTTGNDFIHVSGDGLTAPPGYNDIPGATDGDDVITSGGGGNDIIHAGGGNDRIVFGSDFTGADSVDGGSGTNTVEFNGDYKTAVQFATATLANVETLQLDAGHSYNLNFDHAAVSTPLTIDGSALTASDSLTVSAQSTLGLSLTVIGGAGDDHISVNNNVLHVDLSRGGNDTLSGGNAGCFIYMGAALNAGDHILGDVDPDDPEKLKYSKIPSVEPPAAPAEEAAAS